MQRRMLSAADEASTNPDETEVRREDQDKINTFSRLHQRELKWEDQLALKHKQKEELDDISTELELADEDENVPYLIGDVFVHVPVAQAQEMLEVAVGKIDEEIGGLEEKLGQAREEMGQLKVALYARFGKSINLET